MNTFRTFLIRILHQSHDLCGSRIIIPLYDPCFEYAVQVDAPAVEPVPRPHGPWFRLACKRLHINSSRAGSHDSVHRDFLSWFKYDDLSQQKFLGRHDLFCLPHFQICILRTDINKSGNRFLSPAERDFFHKLSHLIEQHSRHSFLMSPYCKCPCCRYDHKQVLIQELFFCKFLQLLPICRHRKYRVSQQEHYRLRRPCHVFQLCHCPCNNIEQQPCPDLNALFPCLFCHSFFPSAFF